MIVIGHLRWEDFVEEARRLHPGTVRVRTYHRSYLADKRFGLYRESFVLEVAFAVDAEVHVARFQLGEAWEHDLKHNAARREEMVERMERAGEIARQALEAQGFTVRPGIIARAEEAKVRTGGLLAWQEENGRRVPVPAEEVAA